MPGSTRALGKSLSGGMDATDVKERHHAVEPDRIRVLLADDHAMLRAGTRRILEDERDIEVVGEAGNGDEAVELAERTQPDVVLLDISMPGRDGIEAFPGLRQAAPHTRIVVLTAHDELAYVRACARQGAAGYLLKSAAPHELIAAIRQVHQGEPVFAVSVNGRQAETEHSAAGLTPREHEVIRLVASGQTNREVAETLHVSASTIEFHLRNIYTKLGASVRADAVLTAQRLGWLDRPDSLC